MSADALLATWTGPARQRGLWRDLAVALPLVLAFSLLAWRVWGVAPAAILLIAGVAATALFARRRAARFDRRWLVRRLDDSRHDMEDSAALLFAPPRSLGPLQRLQQQRLAARLDAGLPNALVPDWPRRMILIAWAAALAIIALVAFWPAAGDRPVILAPSAEGLPATPGVPRLIAQNLRIIPPAYTGLPIRDVAQLDARAPQGSRIEWTLRFAPRPNAPAITLLREQRLPLARSGQDWAISRTLDAAFLYRVEAAPGVPPLPPLHRIDAIADAPPQVKVISPTQSLTMVTAGQRSWTPVFTATDDYGVAATARLRLTLAIGEGENVTFSEREIALSGSGPARNRRFAPSLDFGRLGFGPGSDLVIQLIVRDNRAPNPQDARGPSLILRWPSAKVPESGGLEGMVNTVLPAYFRSQRQIIIDAEALLKQQRRLAPDRYLSRSAGIGSDQEILRGRYSQFLGGESEGQPDLPTSDGTGHSADDGHDHGPPQTPAPGFGAPEDVLAAFGHPHDESQASSLDPETRAILKKAVDEMWQSERELKTGHPDLALPYAYRALRFIKEVQQATRIFLSRVGPELPPFDPSRRMTGKREGLASRILPLPPVEGDDGPAVTAWRALGTGQAANSLDPLDRWVRANAGRLPDALALSGAIDAVRRDPRCARCRASLRALLWTAMARPAGKLVRRRPADAGGARYLGAL